MLFVNKIIKIFPEVGEKMTKVRTSNRYLDLVNISKYTQDPNVYYNGRKNGEKLTKVIGTIKAVRLG